MIAIPTITSKLSEINKENLLHTIEGGEHNTLKLTGGKKAAEENKKKIDAAKEAMREFVKVASK